ncbi:hypothetical protein [Nocardioides albidus]|nr:hypothetical protein [Nocardioides albidus]
MDRRAVQLCRRETDPEYAVSVLLDAIALALARRTRAARTPSRRVA